MNKYSIIAIVLSIIFGLVVGAKVANHFDNKELFKTNEVNKQLQEDLQVHKDSIGMLYETITTMDRVIRLDDSIIHILKKTIDVQDSITQTKRDEVAKYTPDERRDWLIKRYSQ